MNILVVAPHPDDETLGCGGTLLKHRQRGDILHWVIMTAMVHGSDYNDEQIAKRQKEIQSVKEAYGFHSVSEFGFPTSKLDSVPQGEMISRMSRVIEVVEPCVIYIPHYSDVHSDHRITVDVVMAAGKTFRAPCVKRILMYETVSETEFGAHGGHGFFEPNSYSDISEYFDRKMEILQIYESEIAKHPFPRSRENLHALATFRGAYAGVCYAEAFMLVKELW